jgi:uncharacterized membrane protein
LGDFVAAFALDQQPRESVTGATDDPGMESGAGNEHVPPRRARFHRDQSELEFARIVAFSDGVFAIAITLLVLSLQIPEGLSDLPKALGQQWPDFFAFALSFAVLTRVWLFHHRFFGSLERFDSRLIQLNFLYLAAITLVPFTGEVLGDYGHEPAAAILYAVNMAALGAIGAVTTEYAFRRELIKADVADALEIEPGPSNWLVAAVFVVSIPIALVDARAAELTWLILFTAAVLVLRGVHSRRGIGSVD